ncbi:unnamed protein product [Cyprideis torosa]|uniref:Fucosyltransferase n=1 Tax=Cyprideis torosa TaxID=163714 RepID=A0A7R8WDM9_9CRUS|nr:unnamed protein product [Cyprideis torosa]CAG0894893.1 unnamed protein product [Cyprideis torosa]
MARLRVRTFLLYLMVGSLACTVILYLSTPSLLDGSDTGDAGSSMGQTQETLASLLDGSDTGDAGSSMGQTQETLASLLDGSDTGDAGSGASHRPDPPPQLPWFFEHGSVAWPSRSTDKLKVWPHEDPGDRIVAQLSLTSTKDAPIKRIKLDSKFRREVALDNFGFLKEKCPVDRCQFSKDDETADVVIFKDWVPDRPPGRSNQIWVLYMLESPFHTAHGKKNAVNWTATYRHDSDLVAPYDKWVYYDPRVKRKQVQKNYATGKTKKVAWFVSNCGAKNGRLEFAKELSKYIDVDIYGRCGKRMCSRWDPKCFNLLNSDYKFYLAFENSNCRDYITEKLFKNGLSHDILPIVIFSHDILPIVMGAHPEDYARATPVHSFIHVEDFAGPKELADYLHHLDRNDDLYNEYFEWKGTGEMINTAFWCRLCAMAHEPSVTKSYDVNEWWRGNGACRRGSWTNDKLAETTRWWKGWTKGLEPDDLKYDLKPDGGGRILKDPSGSSDSEGLASPLSTSNKGSDVERSGLGAERS